MGGSEQPLVHGMPATTPPPVRRPSIDLVDAVVDNMRQNLEALKYATLAPSRYTVYLSAAEIARLEGILPRLQAEAIRALDEELARHNRQSWLRRRLPWLPASRHTPLENAGPQWHVEFRCDTDGELEGDGDILVHSDLVLPPDAELGLGERTRRFTTVRAAGAATAAATVTALAAAVTAGGPPARARLVWRDDGGEHRHEMTGELLTIGRGGRGYSVDVKITSSEDVSREHARIRHDAVTGLFHLTDLSSLGTTLDGRHVPRGVDTIDGARRENGVETLLPPRARLGLAETVFVDVEAGRA